MGGRRVWGRVGGLAPLPHAPPPGAKFLPSTCSSHCQIGAAPSAPQHQGTHLTPTHLQNHAATNTTPGTFKWVSPSCFAATLRDWPARVGFLWGGRFLFTTAQSGGRPFQKPNNSSHQNPIILAGQAWAENVSRHFQKTQFSKLSAHSTQEW